MKKWVCSVCGYVYEGEQPPVEHINEHREQISPQTLCTFGGKW